MYPGSAIIEGYLPAFSLASLGLSTALPNEEIGMPYGMDYSQQADFFFQVVFVATAMSIVSGAVAGQNEVNTFLFICYCFNSTYLPYPRRLELGWWLLKLNGLLRLCWIWEQCTSVVQLQP
jgi:Amt family ammonium transporter